MKVGMIGLGKLGLPVATALGHAHTVYGYDVNPDLMRKRQYLHVEEGICGKSFDQMLFEADIRYSPLQVIAQKCRVIFVAVQTPHDPMYEGVTKMPSSRRDFDYTYLKRAISSLAPYLTPKNVVAVISTVLPGTMRREILPIIESTGAGFVYNPSFIAMGTVLKDYCNPEFILIGHDEKNAKNAALVGRVHRSVHHKLLDIGCREPILAMGIESAELAKVAYNTMIGMKIAYANALMEVCHHTGADVDEVMSAIKSATDRLISTQYLTPGMGDGGGCHPRDGIAMSWLARKHDLSYDFFGQMMLARERQTEWLADLAMRYAKGYGGPNEIILLGKSFKPNTRIATGSPAVLLMNILESRNAKVTVTDDPPLLMRRAVYVVSTRHSWVRDLKFKKGSVVIDPHRYVKDQDGVTIVRLGSK